MRRWLALALIVFTVVLAVGAAWLFQPDSAAIPASLSGITQTQDIDTMRVSMYLDDAVVGNRTITVQLHNLSNVPLEVQSVSLRFSMAEMEMGTIEVPAARVGPGQFRASGSFFAMAGRWNVDVAIARDSTSPRTAAFVFPIAMPGEASGPLNPLSPDAATLAAARPLYQANCASCHGATGRGDGPVAVGLRPAPGDFTQHMQLGKHTDGQVFLWIKDGYPGTAMPAWGKRLTETQIWQLVTYLRTLGQGVTTAAQTPAVAETNVPTQEPAAQIQEPLPPLVFIRQGNIWWSQGDGSAPRPITALAKGTYAEYPTLAPNGQHIAFVTTTQGPLGEEDWPLANPETSLEVMSADGLTPRTLWKPEQGRLGLTAWSPDNSAIYVGVYTLQSALNAPVLDRSFQVVRVDVQSGARTIVQEDAYDFTFAADGRLVAFLRWHENVATFTLNVAAPDGSGEREVILGQTFSNLYAPRFSPDGRQLIFASTSGPSTDEHGNPIKTGTQSVLDQVLGLFSPSVAEAHGAASELWIVNVDGSGLRRLTTLREDTPMGIFSSDGTQIIVMGAGGMYRMNTYGSNVRKIDPLGDHGGLDWGRR